MQRNLLVLTRKGDSTELSVGMQTTTLPGDICVRMQPGSRVTIEIEPVAAPPVAGIEIANEVPTVPSLRALRGGPTT